MGMGEKNFLKKFHREIILYLLVGIGLFSYFLLTHISIHAFLLFLFLIGSFYFAEKIFSLDFEKRHYVYFIVIALGFLFFYYLHLLFVYVDKPLHLFGGFMLASLLYHVLTKKRISSRYIFPLLFLFSLTVISGYEFYEYLLDQFFDAHMQGVYQTIDNQKVVLIGSVADTIQDVMLGLFGVLGSVLIARR